MIKFCKFVTFHDFLSSVDIFQQNFFQKIFSGITTECQTNSLDILSGLIWIQTVCKGCQQMTKFAASRQKVKKKKYTD